MADAVVVQPREILIDGKTPGTVSLIVWGSATRAQYDVVVEQPIVARATDSRAVSGRGRDGQHQRRRNGALRPCVQYQCHARIGEIAAASLPKAQLINLLQVPGGSESQRVMLQVRFAEVNRRQLEEAGLALFVARERFPRAVHDAAVRGA